MANASRTTMGPGTHGKGAGVGAMTELPEDLLEENMVLSNRDKAQHSDQRGLDSKGVQIEQFQDTASNRLVDGEDGTTGGTVSGLANPMSDTSGEDGSLKQQS